MAASNYDLALEQARVLFLRYDQALMVERFQLEADEKTIFLPFVGQTFAIERSTGAVTWRDADGVSHSAGHDAAMSIYDVLCCSKPLCRPSGQYAPINSVARSFHSSGLGEDLFDKWSAILGRDPRRLEEVCVSLGGIKDAKGDVSYRLAVFPFLSVLLRFWEADDEFPASLQLLWDTNTLDFVHYETTYYIAGHLLSRLRDLL